MRTRFSQFLATVSVAALSLGALPVTAQQAVTETQAPANSADAPLVAPDTAARRQQIMPDSFADLVEKVSPAVVNINTTSVIEQPTGPVFPEGSPFSDLFREFGFPTPDQGQGDPRFGGRGQQQAQRANALGSGFVISDDGYIVTNNHVIEGADEIEIEFKDGARRKAEVVGTDKQTDIALLKVDATDLPYVGFGNSDDARVGDWVLALGNPLGQGFSASTGIVSARGRALTGTYDDFIQTDASINRGNSGGPLFNMDGEVIGVNTAILSPNGGSIGIGFSMASNVVGNVVQQLREFGETRRGWLGVKIQRVTPEIAESLGLDNENGAMVTDVPDGPAADAGVKSGDVIVSFDGNDITDDRDLVARVAQAPIGEKVDVTVLRDGKSEDLQVTLGRRETAEGTASDEQSAPAETSDDTLGMQLQTLTPEIAAELGMSGDQQGLVVREVDPSSDAADKGLSQGDVITEAGQQAVNSVSDLRDRITEAKDAGRKSLLLMIRRGGEPRFVALSIED
ncbi:DegQ family serine endoprotease [Paracoccus aurantiacus]|uniref:Probable periplasmic serine endoprotease DegP-like n=1 Tax=Paracoccus aurantiacus TaxID=2599412 RepID=A0A5C6S9F0_9RHOB|nr:DegQ family serine endoprotease [Paracoccus aurantiacus]TXB71028.1 DegQ family serine endoprotease [Paracoccus aurantiacus]